MPSAWYPTFGRVQPTWKFWRLGWGVLGIPMAPSRTLFLSVSLKLGKVRARWERTRCLSPLKTPPHSLQDQRQYHSHCPGGTDDLCSAGGRAMGTNVHVNVPMTSYSVWSSMAGEASHVKCQMSSQNRWEGRGGGWGGRVYNLGSKS